MSGYTQLTQEARYQIYAYLKAGFTQTAIADQIGVHKSTISRELSRNKGQRGYRPKQAHQAAVNRKREAPRFAKMNPELIAIIEHLVGKDWSPEQIAGALNKNSETSVISHETIYQYIYKDKAYGGQLYKHLRHAGKKRKKRYGSHDRRGRIKNRVGIEQRPAIVNEKKRIGDWEIDTVVGKNHKGFLVTLVERKSKYTLIRRVVDKSAKQVAQATIDILKPHHEMVFTVTGDNGKEFADHQEIAHELEADFFFAHPYCSWERGLNENTNGLIRQYFPKGTDFRKINDDQVEFVTKRLNHRPRKTLDFKSPHEVLFGQSTNIRNIQQVLHL